MFEQGFGHARDHPGLGNRLAIANRQRGVFVGPRGQGLVDEQMPGNTTQRREHALVANAALAAQAINHAVARALRGHALPGGFRLEMEARRHAPSFNAADKPPTQLATVSSAW